MLFYSLTSIQFIDNKKIESDNSECDKGMLQENVWEDDWWVEHDTTGNVTIMNSPLNTEQVSYTSNQHLCSHSNLTVSLNKTLLNPSTVLKRAFKKSFHSQLVYKLWRADVCQWL